MAGTKFSIEPYGLKGTAQQIEKLVANGTSELALREVGEYLLESTQQRFIEMQAPDGTPWEPLAIETLRNKKRPDRILTEEGNLADLLSYQLNSNELLLGSNLEYAATHQFGRDDIPERPFLGLATFERKEVIAIIQDHILNG